MAEELREESSASSGQQLSRAQRRAQERKNRKLGKNIVESKQAAIDKRAGGTGDSDDEPQAIAEQPKMNIKGTAPRIGAGKDPAELVRGFVCISYTAPTGARQRSREVNVKIRSPIFYYESSADEDAAFKQAEAHAELVHQTDPDFDVFIVEAGAWISLPMPQQLKMKVPMHYDNEEQEKIMQGYYRGVARESKMVQQRVKNAKEEAAERMRKYHEETGTAPITDRKERPEYTHSEPDPNAQATAEVPFRKSIAEEEKERQQREAAQKQADEERKQALEQCTPYDLWGAAMNLTAKEEGEKEWWQ